MREAVLLLSPAMAPMKGSPVTEESAGGGGGGGLNGEDRWRYPNAGGSTVNAVSFGFVATAILISMFLFMALFEHFLRPRSDSTGGGNPSRPRRSRFGIIGWWGRNHGADLEANKLSYPSPERTVYAKELSVLMPGQDVPTYIANPVPPPVSPPVPCLPEKVCFPSHQPINLNNSSSSSSSTNPT